MRPNSLETLKHVTCVKIYKWAKYITDMGYGDIPIAKKYPKVEDEDEQEAEDDG